MENLVFNNNGRPEVRKGYVNQTQTTPTTGSLLHLHEFLQDSGVTSLFAVSDDFTILSSRDNGVTWIDVSGDLATTLHTQELQFATLNGQLFLGAFGHHIHVFDETTESFVEVSESPVCRGSLIATFGRLWMSVDGDSIIAYSGLLTGTDWTSAAAGAIDASNAWTQDFDNVEALASFGATLVVFGTDHILLYVDGAGSELGVDPDNLYVVDTIEGTGCRDRDSIITIGEGDLWFLGPQGIQSLQRVIQDRVNPLADLSRHQRELVLELRLNNDAFPGSVRAMYSPEERFVLFLFPQSRMVLGYDTRFAIDEGLYRAYTWKTQVPYTGGLVRRNGDVLFGLPSGGIGLYDQYRDDAGGPDESPIEVTYGVPPLDLDVANHNLLKIIKSFYLDLAGSGTLSGTAYWSYDFMPANFKQEFTSFEVPATSNFNLSQYNLDSFRTGDSHRTVRIAGLGQGKTFQFMIQFTNTDDNQPFSIVEVGVNAKLGRRVESS